jgi:hypothetical protein
MNIDIFFDPDLSDFDSYLVNYLKSYFLWELIHSVNNSVKSLKSQTISTGEHGTLILLTNQDDQNVSH